MSLPFYGAKDNIKVRISYHNPLQMKMEQERLLIKKTGKWKE